MHQSLRLLFYHGVFREIGFMDGWHKARHMILDLTAMRYIGLASCVNRDHHYRNLQRNGIHLMQHFWIRTISLQSKRKYGPFGTAIEEKTPFNRVMTGRWRLVISDRDNQGIVVEFTVGPIILSETLSALYSSLIDKYQQYKKTYILKANTSEYAYVAPNAIFKTLDILEFRLRIIYIYHVNIHILLMTFKQILQSAHPR